MGVASDVCTCIARYATLTTGVSRDGNSRLEVELKFERIAREDMRCGQFVSEASELN